MFSNHSCKTPGCSQIVKSPYWYCFKCNMERKKLLTGRCECGRAIKPEFSTCFTCFQKEKSECVVGENGIGCGSGVNLSETVDATPYEPKTESV